MSGSREDIRKQIGDRWVELKAQLTDVPAIRMDESDVVGPWSVKNVVGHITTWERETMTAVSNYVAGRDPASLAWKEDLDGFNLQAIEDTRSKSLGDLMNNLDQTHEELLAWMTSLPDDALTVDGVTKRIDEDTHNHYAEHTASIGKWLDAGQLS